MCTVSGAVRECVLLVELCGAVRECVLLVE